MTPQDLYKKIPNLPPEPVGYRVGDLVVDIAARRVSLEGAVIQLKPLSFDLLVALVRAAPNLVSFDQLNERVWPGLVVSPETIVQRVKLLRDAFGDDAQAPRYIEGVRGRGYRLIAEVRALTMGNGKSKSYEQIKDNEAEGIQAVHAGVTAAGTDAGSTLSPALPLPPGAAGTMGPRHWIGGALAILGVLATTWVIARYGVASKPAELTSSGAPPAVRSLAVLPLVNLSGDKEQEYFADGMTDALITDLAQIASLKVTSRTSAMHFKGSQERMPQIGQALQVDAVVEGTVVRSANRVRVTAQLVDASTDHHLWARTYERDLKDVLTLQDDIAHDITEQIRVKVSPKDRSLLIQVHSVDPEAYDFSLKGWYWLRQASQESTEAPSNDAWEKAHDYFQKAVTKDPGYAFAYAGLADWYLGRYLCELNKETLIKSKDAVDKALALNPSLAEAHAVLAMYKFFIDWDWPGAEAEFKEATVRNPSYARAHLWYSVYLESMGRLDEASKEIEHAQDLDPFSVLITDRLEQVLFHERRYDDALRQNQRSLALHPENGAFYWENADIYEQKKMFPEAFAARQQALKLGGDPRLTALADAYQRSGYRGYLLAQVELLGAHNPPYTAHLYALLGDEARAMAALEKAYKERSPGILYIRISPELDSMRSGPRYRDLVRRIGFPDSSGAKN